MHFGLALQLSDTDLWNIDLLAGHLDLLSPDKYTDIPNSILFVSIISSRRLQDMSWKRLQCNKFSSSKSSCKMSLRRLCKMPSRRLQEVF